MKTHWFSVLSVAVIVLLAGVVNGSEVRWGKPANSEPVASSVMHIPTIITTDEVSASPIIQQVQQVEPVQPPARLAPQVAAQSDHYLETKPRDRSVPSGATLRNEPLMAPSVIPPSTGRGPTTTCSEQIVLKSIKDVSHDIRPTRSDALPEECMIDQPVYYGRHFGQTCFMWKASALSTQAAYFEDVQLERYGNTIVCPALQPIVSGAKFFATIPILPYKMGVTPPNECVYTLGHRRSGNRAPYMVEPFPISPRGALFQAGAVAGGIAIIP